MAASLALSLVNIYETLAICWPTLIDAARGRMDKATIDQRLADWAVKVTDHVGAEVKVEGREHLAPGKTFLVMSNHQSLYDIPVIFRVIGSNLRMVAKKELFQVPVFGKAIELGGFINIDRSDRAAAIASLESAKKTLASGTHVWMAPEGTRSRSGALLPFKKGGFNLALEAGLPILPVTLSGTRDILEAKGLRSRSGARVTVTVHPPVHPSAYGDGAMPGTAAWKAARDRLMSDIRSALERGL
jgi:1-acyl-sn-glycerol-3-phosphate acyltransferase